jgi:type III restriction enzyme
MDNRLFERPILNSPSAYPARHWELDAQGQSTGSRVLPPHQTVA